MLVILTLATTACVVYINPGGVPLATYTPFPTYTPPIQETIQCTVSKIVGTNVAAGKPIVSRSGGVTYGTHSDVQEYNTTTNPNGGDWLYETNAGKGTYQVVDLGRVYTLTGIGYRIHWDGTFVNPLTFQVGVSTDGNTWTVVSKVAHPHTKDSNTNWVDVDIGICPVEARYVKYEEPPDGEWNGWGNFFQLKAYSSEGER